MHFPLHVEKTIQAIGVLFRHDGMDCMNSMRILKLLYIADRESIQETGRAIVGGPIVAMERGPVLLEVYDLIRGQHKDMPLWDEFYRTVDYSLAMRKHPDVKKLSKYQIGKLQEVAERHKKDDEWALSNLTHQFPEWEKNNPGKSCRPISFDDLLDAIGMSDQSAEIASELAHIAKMRHQFESKPA